ncbi:MAG: glucose 1-dehydrogenase [Planctomycetota bacterium]
MSNRFENKSVLLTGGTSGIGKETALAFAREGANVAITGRRAELGEGVVKEIEATGSKGLFIQGDIREESHIQDAVNQTVAAFGGLQIAVNNAGIETAAPIPEVSADDIDFVLAVNVKGVILSMKHEIPAILKTLNGASSGGSIINLSSVAGHIGLPGASVYIASKHAVEGATKTAALEVAQQGIRVNAVSPGGIETDMLDRFTGHDMDSMAAMHPMGRIGKPHEIADAILWLSSDQSSFVTGQSILVDGGMTTD